MLIWPLVARIGGLYRSRRAEKNLGEAFQIVKTSLGALVALVMIAYFHPRPSLFPSDAPALGRIDPLPGLLWTVGLTLSPESTYALWVEFKTYCRCGDGDSAKSVVDTILADSSLGLNIVGHVGDKPAHPEVPYLGTFDALPEVVESSFASAMDLDASPRKNAVASGAVEVMQSTDADIRLIPDIIQYATLGRGVEDFSGFPCIDLQSSPQGGFNLLLKRSFDMAVGGLLNGSRVATFSGAGLAREVNESGTRLFTLKSASAWMADRFGCKFRSMVGNAESAGAQMAEHNDPRCTLVGRWMRRYSLDELPQLLNVLRGEMSLVGPRPERPCFIEDFKRDIPGYALRHKAKAGMTGLAQVRKGFEVRPR